MCVCVFFFFFFGGGGGPSELCVRLQLKHPVKENLRGGGINLFQMMEHKFPSQLEKLE